MDDNYPNDATEEKNQDLIERTDLMMIAGFIIHLGIGLALYFVTVPGHEQGCRFAHVAGLAVMGFLPGFECAISFLLRKDVCNCPRYDFGQSVVEKALIFYVLGSLAAVWLACRITPGVGIAFTVITFSIAVTIAACRLIGNLMR